MPYGPDRYVFYRQGMHLFYFLTLTIEMNIELNIELYIKLKTQRLSQYPIDIVPMLVARPLSTAALMYPTC